jgi:dihydroxyacetone kinase-like protein
MLRAVETIEKTLAESGATGLKDLLGEIAWALLGIDGGATGPLFGSLFLGMADATGGRDSVGADDLAAMLEAGLASVRKRTRAQLGDKTLLDALIPAVEALRGAAGRDADPNTGLREAAEAAERGAAATKDLQARFGRAKNIGERSVGHADPGATTVALIFRGFVEGLGPCRT